MMALRRRRREMSKTTETLERSNDHAAWSALHRQATGRNGSQQFHNIYYANCC
jgi:hypothetical protein